MICCILNFGSVQLPKDLRNSYSTRFKIGQHHIVEAKFSQCYCPYFKLGSVTLPAILYMLLHFLSVCFDESMEKMMVANDPISSNLQ
jgi:hypothetical protein